MTMQNVYVYMCSTCKEMLKQCVHVSVVRNNLSR